MNFDPKSPILYSISNFFSSFNLKLSILCLYEQIKSSGTPVKVSNLQVNTKNNS